jgi:hypothetical protein
MKIQLQDDDDQLTKEAEVAKLLYKSFTTDSNYAKDEIILNSLCGQYDSRRTRNSKARGSDSNQAR